MQKMHIASADRPTTLYSLDVIISVGYRVKSRRGVQFRQWATRVLREHLVRGYTFDRHRLAERGLAEARQTLDLLSRTLANQALVDDTGRAVLDLIIGYADTWRLLLEYDENRLGFPPGVRPSSGALDFSRAVAAIDEFKRKLTARGEATSLFGNARGGICSPKRRRLGEPTLKTIAMELVKAVKNNVTIDWTVRENVRANLRVIVKAHPAEVRLSP